MTELAGIKNEVCVKCKLHSNCRSPFMESYGSEEPLVLIIGEAPGEDEDARGIPFIGKAGKLLRQVLPEIGFDVEKDVRFTNVVRCRPEGNKITSKAIDFCSQFAIEDIKKYDPPMVFLMGNSPLSGILGEKGVSNWNGTIIEKSDRIYVPLYHPAYLLRNPQPMDQWLSAMMNAFDNLISEDGTHKAKIQYKYPKTIKEVEEMRDYLAGFKRIGFDTETRHLKAFNKDQMLLSFSFATSEVAYSVPVDHPENPWISKKENNKVKELCIEILKAHDGNIVGHNIKFDQLQTYTLLGHWFEAGGDTILISYLLDSRRGIHGLKRLAGIHIGMFEYDAEIIAYKRLDPKKYDPEKGGSYENIPLNVLEKYGAKDAVAVMLLEPILFEMLSDKQKILYHDLNVPMSNFLAYMERNGFSIDERIAKRYLKIYTARRDEMYEDVLGDSLVQRYVKYHNRKIREYNETIPKISRKKKRKDFVFNPGSAVQMIELVYTFGKIEPTILTKGGSPSVAATTLKLYQNKLQFLDKLRYYNLLNDMISKYLLPATNGKWMSTLDGKVRSSYNMNTKTGRLSSSDPNLQNIPTKEKEPGTLLEYLPIKNEFMTSFEDGLIMSADQSGMETRTFASLANCKKMLEIHRSGRDFHEMVSRMVTKMNTGEIPKHIRYKFKKVTWTLIFGGSAYTLSKIDGFPEGEAEDLVKAYFKEFPEVPEFLEKCIEFAEDHNYIESPFGRREHLYYINDKYQVKLQRRDQRMSENMPIQSSASDLTLMGGIILNRELRKRNLLSRIVNTVHDSLVLDLPKVELPYVAMLTKYCMENVVKLAPIHFPNIDFSWFNCPLVVDIEIGTHYGALEKYEIPEKIVSNFRLEDLSYVH
jgi:DNA polymerase I